MQSGNILFESDETEELLQTKIHDKIKDDFGVSSVVVIRTAEEIQQIISQTPFSNQEISEANLSCKGNLCMLHCCRQLLQKSIVTSFYPMQTKENSVS
ncbi:DUF1697 domain-containing protein [Lysinibacillus sp. NPDC056959]|uniref:DUF1697 domain-containing protein n=1 Tax=Lysinibacillus sp. NPDC056959 TaxID=3345981 RepID=UPI00362DFAE6